MKKIPFSLIVIGFLVIVFGVFSIALITGFFPVRDLLTHFYVFVFALVIISIMGIIGAIFLGMFISHRIFSSRGFTTFEEEMLEMKDDVEYIRDKLEKLEKN